MVPACTALIHHFGRRILKLKCFVFFLLLTAKNNTNKQRHFQTKHQVYDYVFVPEKGDKGEWVPWMSTTEKYSVDPKLQFNEVRESGLASYTGVME